MDDKDGFCDIAPPERLKSSRDASDLPSDLRAYSPAPTKLMTHQLARKTRRQDQIDGSKAFMTALRAPTLLPRLQNPTVGDFVDYPIPAHVSLTQRFTKVKVNDHIPVLER